MVSPQETGRSETDAGRTDGHDRHHRHSARSPRPCNAQAHTPAHSHECCKHAGSTPGQPSQRPVYGCVLHSRAGTRVSRMPSAARALTRVGRSGWSVRGGQHGAVPAPLQRPARPRAPSPALAVGGGAALPRPVRDGGRHRTQSLAAAASCSALQLVAKSPSPATRVAHRMHACWLPRLRACGPASSVRLALRVCTRALCPTSRARSAGRPLLSWLG